MKYEELRAKGPASFAEATGRRRYWQLLDAERAALRNPTTGAIRDELLEHVACAACESDKPYGGFEKDGFTYTRCGTCGTLYINPQLTESTLMRFWSTSEVAAAWAEVLQHPAQRDYDEAKFARALDRLDQEGFGSSRLLDFGSSIGVFLALARARGYDVAGVEPGDAARRVAKMLYGLDLAVGIDAIDDPKLFDVITCWEVLEHTKDPAAHLSALRKRVAPEGRLLILVGGNAAALANRIMRAASAAFDFPRYWYFTPDSFATLLERTNWSVLSTEQLLDEIDVVQAYLGYGDPYQEPRIAEEVFPAALADELRALTTHGGMGYKFLVSAWPSKAGMDQ